ncbi:MAG: hypothetical protein KatS3mg121_0258 [Gammaproteobacteria bacterium]|nr:MAG: hypothetical protein KatS3mg121_0258 [Gammaproteobacteria bacterium]
MSAAPTWAVRWMVFPPASKMWSGEAADEFVGLCADDRFAAAGDQREVAAALVAGGDVLVVELVLDDAGGLGDDLVGGDQAEGVLDVLEVVQADQKQCIMALLLFQTGDGGLEFFEEGRAVEQAGEGVETAELVDLFFELAGVGALADDDLQARFAFDAGRREFHAAEEGSAGEVLELGLEDGLAGAVFDVELPQELLELVLVFTDDQVHDGQAFDVVEMLDAEAFQVSLVGVDVHALVNVGDGVARVVHQDSAARLAFLVALDQFGVAPAQGEGLVLAADDGLEVGEILLQDPVAGAGRH